MCQQIEKISLCVQDAVESSIFVFAKKKESSIFGPISFSSSYLSLQLGRTRGTETSQQQEVVTSFATQQLDHTTS
jgi:hypothetical protein